MTDIDRTSCGNRAWRQQPFQQRSRTGVCSRMRSWPAILLVLTVLGVPVLTTSCNEYSLSDSDKKAVHDMAYANTAVQEVTSGREYKEKFLGTLMSQDMQTKLGGIIEITFTEPFYVERDWPTVKENKTSGATPSLYFTQETQHKALSVKGLQVVVYLRERMVAVAPFSTPPK